MKRLPVLLLLMAIAMLAYANTPGKHSVLLGWQAPVSGCAGGCTYNVYRSATPNACSGTPVPYATGVTSTAYTDSTVTNGSTYYYDVSAVGTGGEGPCSAEISVQIGIPPSAPQSPTATVQ